MKIAFAGTPRFGALVLEALIASRHKVVVVFAQPDRPAGRSRRVTLPPVKKLALAAGLPVEQPESINSPEAIWLLEKLDVNILVIAAFGQILKNDLLDAVPCINVHGSLLPKYRGAAPAERAIMNGERETGASIMKVVLALDAGEVFLRKKVIIDDEDDAGSLSEKVARAGGVALVEVLDQFEAGAQKGEAQNESKATYAGKIMPAERRINWSLPARRIFNQVRALSPHIGAFSKIDGKVLKIWRVAPAAATAPSEGASVGAAGAAVIDGEKLYIRCGDGLLEIIGLQPGDKRRMSAAEFLRGYNRLIRGAILR